MYNNCVSCHREGGIAPFSLVAFDDAHPRARLLASMTTTRQMPPMPVNNDGHCNTYSNARWLSDAQIATIAAWANGGAPAGDPAHGPTIPPAPAGLTDATATLDIGVDYTPDGTITDDYRCFLVDPGITTAAYLTGYEVIPGQAAEVHHVIVYQPTDANAEQQAAMLDAQDARPGWQCFGGAGVSADPRVLWAPGVGATRLPAGTGLDMAAGRRQVVQIHYNTLAGTMPDRTRVRLATAASVARVARFVPMLDGAINLPPHMTNATGTNTAQLPANIPATVYGVLPHMHTLGRTLNVSVTASGANRCLVDVDRWNFHWQNAWWYSQPMSLRSTESITITCGYDTTTRTSNVRWGEGTQDEMCLAYLYVTYP